MIVSAFYGRGKKHAWEVWNKFSAVTEVFTKISQAPNSIPENIMGLAEQFVVLLYPNSLEYVATVDKARSKLFQFGGKDFDHLPPPQNAFKHHVQSTQQVTYGVELYKNVQQCLHLYFGHM